MGAGLAGLACARALRDGGVSVRVLDKGRGVGGRCCTRRAELGTFDHGAVRFTARAAPFRELVDEWRGEGVVAAQGERGLDDPWWIPTPTASALPRALARGLDVGTGLRVERLARGEGGWTLVLEDGATEGPFDRVVLTAPAAQAAALLAPVEASLASALEAVEHAPCWALMVALEGVVEPQAPVAEPEGAVVLVARQDLLPGRGGPARAVVHAGEDWSRAHLERAPEDVARLLAAEAAPLLGGASIAWAQAHRWRYARVARALGEPFLSANGLAVAGDGLLGPRLELAWESGRHLGERLRAELG